MKKVLLKTSQNLMGNFSINSWLVARCSLAIKEVLNFTEEAKMCLLSLLSGHGLNCYGKGFKLSLTESPVCN